MNRPTLLGTCALLATLLLSGSALAEEPEVPEYAQSWKETWLEAREKGSLQVVGRLSTPVVGPGPQELFAVLELRTVDFPPGERAPAAVALIIDRSASTAGRRLFIAKKAALAVLAGLTEQDQLSIIRVGNKPEVFPLQPVTAENREKMKTYVEETHALGRSDLSAGLEEAFDALTQLKNTNHYRQALLFSDGQATEGMVDAAGLAQIAHEARDQHSIHVSTVAIGSDADFDLMAGMAKSGWGFAARLNSSSDVEQVAKRQRMELMQRAAARISLSVRLAPTVKLVEVFGHEAARQGNTLEFPIGELGPGEVLPIVLHLSTDNAGKEPRPIEIAWVELQYVHSLIEHTRTQQLALKTEFRPPPPKRKGKKQQQEPVELDSEAMRHAARAILARNIAQAQEKATEGDAPGGLKLLEETRDTLQQMGTEARFEVAEELAVLEARTDELAQKYALTRGKQTGKKKKKK